MPYTNKSLTWAWCITLGLFVLTGSGVATGSWLLLLFLIALAAPALILRVPSQLRASAASSERAGIVPDERNRSPLDLGKVDVYRWENEGGARRKPFGGGVPDPAHAAP